MQKLKWIGLFAAAALVVLTAGCHHDDSQNPAVLLHGEVIPDHDSSEVWRIRGPKPPPAHARTRRCMPSTSTKPG